MATYFRSDGWVKSATGPAVPGAAVFICLQPASIPTGLSVIIPAPSPLANIFADVNGLVPIAQPILTDGFGHYDFYTLPGFYTLAVYLNNKLQRFYPDQTVGVSGSAVSSLVLQVNGVPNILQNLLNLKNSPSVTFLDNLDGSVSAVTVASPTLVLEVNGVHNVNQALLNFKDSASVTWVDNGDGSVSAAGASNTDSVSFGSHGFTAPGSVLSTPPPTIGTALQFGGILTIVSPTATAPRSISDQISSNPGFGYTFEGSGPGTPVYEVSTGSLGTMRARVGRGAIDSGEAILMWVGFTDTDPTLTGGVHNYGLWTGNTAAFNFIGFRYDTGSLDVGWACVASNGSTQTVVLTSLAPNVMRVLKIVKVGTAFQFYIDGTLITTTSGANSPAPGVAMTPIVGANSNSGIGQPDMVISNFWWTDNLA